MRGGSDSPGARLRAAGTGTGRWGLGQGRRSVGPCLAPSPAGPVPRCPPEARRSAPRAVPPGRALLPLAAEGRRGAPAPARLRGSGPLGARAGGTQPPGAEAAGAGGPPCASPTLRAGRKGERPPGGGRCGGGAPLPAAETPPESPRAAPAPPPRAVLGNCPFLQLPSEPRVEPRACPRERPRARCSGKKAFNPARLRPPRAAFRSRRKRFEMGGAESAAFPRSAAD